MESRTRIAALLLAPLVALAGAGATVAAETPMLKIAVGETGVYQVGHAKLVQAGWPCSIWRMRSSVRPWSVRWGSS